MSSAYEALLREVCVQLGFCGSVVAGEPSLVDMFLPEKGAVSAGQFVDAVFRAEGWDDPQGAAADEHRKNICDAFVRHMGSAEVDAQLLK